MLHRKPVIEFGIIGLGRFGHALATSLAEAGREIIVLDSNERKVKQIRNLTENAFIVGELSRQALEEAGIQNCETVVVCIGEKIDASILTTMNLISMGVPHVIAKAISLEHGSILQKMGAEVIYPEHDMALRLASRLLSSRVMDYISLNDDIAITELRLTSKLSGCTVLQSDIRQKYKLNIIAVQHKNGTTTDITPNLLLNENDIIVVVGKKDDISRLEGFLLYGK